jgi:diguanylate cyclase (GGDEF)-like protein/PAS domain S-box-containing protein
VEVQASALRDAARGNRTIARFMLGAGLALAGVALVEVLLAAGLTPLGPIGWPGLGMLAATAICGFPGLTGGAVVTAAYYLLNMLPPERFAGFYAQPHIMVFWVIAFGAMTIVILLARPRLLRLAATEAELSTRLAFEDALRASEQRLRVITDNLPGLISYIDSSERYHFSNRAYEDWLRMPRSQMAGRTVREVWGERYAVLKPNIERALRGERVVHDQVLTEEGVERHLLVSYVPDFDAAGGVKGFFVLGSDVTQLAAARRELAAEHARLEAALDGSNVALWDTDLHSGRVYLSDAWAGILGAPAGDTVVSVEDLLALTHPDDVEAVKRVGIETMKSIRKTYAIEHRVRAGNGDWKWILSRGRVTQRDADGRALRMIGTNLDITDRKRMEDALHSVAHSDSLTGLANRALFSDRLQLALARARRAGTHVALLYLDLDRFKEVNDTLGHAAGDALLKDFAARLRAGVRATDTVARFGGDEFVVLLEDMNDREHALRVAEKIVRESARPLRFEERDVVATVSIGVAFAHGGVQEEDLLRRADAALYQAKAAGRGAYRVAA